MKRSSMGFLDRDEFHRLLDHLGMLKYQRDFLTLFPDDDGLNRTLLLSPPSHSSLSLSLCVSRPRLLDLAA